MNDTDTNDQGGLPAAPGQYGYKPPEGRTGYLKDLGPADDPYSMPWGYRQSNVPRLNPYVPTSLNPALRDRAHHDWGTDDYVLQGMGRYPGAPAGNYVPTEADASGIVHYAASVLGPAAPPSIAMPMINGARFWQVGQSQATMKGAMQAAKMNQENAVLNMKIANQRLKDLLRRYSSAFADYGPEGAGKEYDADKFHHAVESIAREYGDQTVLNMLNNQDWGALERHLRHLDSAGQDLGKMLGARSKELDIELKKARLERERQKAKDEEDQAAPYRLHPEEGPAVTSTGAPAGRAPGRAVPTEKYGPPPTEKPGDTQLNWDKVPDKEAPDEPLPPEEPDQTAAPSKDEASPPDELSSPDIGDQAEAQPETTEQPQSTTQLAQAARTAGAPVMAADDERDDPAALPPESQPTEGRGLPNVSPPDSPPAPTETGQPRLRVSPTLELARARNWNPDQINSLAQRRANGSLTIQDLQALPKPVKSLMEARRGEIESEMDALLARKDLKGEDVFKEIDKINPEFSHTLRGYIGGDFPVPASAWKNPQYLDRIVGLGQMADSTFNASTFKVRSATKQSYASGQDARNITSIATLDRHAARMINDLQTLQKLTGQTGPGPISRLTGNNYYANLPFIRMLAGQSPEVRALMNRIENDEETVATEYQRAVTGGKPTVTGVGGEKSNLDWRFKGIDEVIATVQNRQAFAHERMHVLIERYKAVVGRNEDALGRLYTGWARNPNSRQGITQQGSEIPEPALDGDTYNDAIGMFKQHAAPQRSSDGYTIREIK